MLAKVGKRVWDDHTDKVSRRSTRWATSDRGWFFIGHECLGHYLDYGPEHYRSPHEYCRAEACDCAESQPGSVHAVRFRRTVGQVHSTQARYFREVAEAKSWIEAYQA